MFTATILITIALAHTQLYTPKPKFYIQVTANFPSAECSQITYTNNNPAANIVMFTAQLQSKFAGSLLAYFSACGSNSPKTDHNAQAPIPADGHVKIQADSQHPGYYEFYIDDTKVAGGTWQVGQTPESLPIDFSRCSGTCKFRYMMAAVHQQPIQLYDNIVTLTGGTGSPAGYGVGYSNPNPTITTLVNDFTKRYGTMTKSSSGDSTFLSCLDTQNVAKLEQCGGLEYNGPTTCASGLTCKMLNPHYYQCRD